MPLKDIATTPMPGTNFANSKALAPRLANRDSVFRTQVSGSSENLQSNPSTERPRVRPSSNQTASAISAAIAARTSEAQKTVQMAADECAHDQKQRIGREGQARSNRKNIAEQEQVSVLKKEVADGKRDRCEGLLFSVPGIRSFDTSNPLH